jgi:predicted patatin/cPLA2 family phospholipase
MLYSGSVRNSRNRKGVFRLDTGRATVFSRLLQKRDLLRGNDPAHAEIKTALLVAEGCMRGVYSAGVLMALYTLGLSDAFDHVLGISAGAANCAYFVSGQYELGASLYFEELSGNRFISRKRFWRMVDIDYFATAMSDAKPLNAAAIREARSQLLIGVTEVNTGQCLLIDARDPSIHIVSAIAASCAIPVLYNKSVQIMGVDCADGAIGCGIPVGYAADVLGCTDILVVFNNPFRGYLPAPGFAEKLAIRTVCRSFPSSFRSAAINRHVAQNREMTVILEGHQYANIGVIAPESLSFGGLTTNGVQLRREVQRAELETMTLFGV